MSELEIRWRLRDERAEPAPLDHPTETTEAADLLNRLQTGADEATLIASAGTDLRHQAMLFYQLDRLKRQGRLVAELRAANKLLATLLPRT
ncbi:MAG: hypothetical protein AAGF49_15785, partial [Pseudomonadota bacterium]